MAVGAGALAAVVAAGVGIHLTYLALNTAAVTALGLGGDGPEGALSAAVWVFRGFGHGVSPAHLDARKQERRGALTGGCDLWSVCFQFCHVAQCRTRACTTHADMQDSK